jgi:hypothetical protein
MAEVNDIRKLRPELLEKSAAELERMVTEIQMAQEHLRHEARKKEVEQRVNTINDAIETFNRAATTLNEMGFLNADVRAVLTTASGSFAPHLKHKAVDAERVLGRMVELDGDAKPKRTRRKKSET